MSRQCFRGHIAPARGADYDIAVAAKIGDTERVRQLLRADPDLATAVPAYSTYYSGHPLRNACALGDVDTVELLLASGADPNTPELGIAPRGGALHAAAGKGHLKIARMLLERGADPNAEVESSGNCMHIAGRNTKMLKLLASYGGEYAPYQDLSQLSKQALKAVYGNEMPLRYYVQKIDMPVLIARIDANPALAAEVLEMASGSCDAESTRLVRYCVARDPVAALHQSRGRTRCQGRRTARHPTGVGSALGTEGNGAGTAGCWGENEFARRSALGYTAGLGTAEGARGNRGYAAGRRGQLLMGAPTRPGQRSLVNAPRPPSQSSATPG